ncbi:hypothetical protein AB7C87_04360 [Natrarchaeobius sp. A-rgal3]|uniref:hypothetical protein n=1 Tax=Natrarchaeobius versutus TaxID=1679078 RepID=UPI00350F5F56
MRIDARRLAVVAPFGAVALLVGYHPVFLFGLLVGVVLPDVDAADERVHRSWFFHTFLPPTVAFVALSAAGVDGAAVTFVHFVTLGMVAHFVLDFVYPRVQRNPGAEWPVRPTIGSAPWGILWLGLSWSVQWFLYLSVSFLPWVIGV